MIFTGIGDEAGDLLSDQVAATLELGWRHIEARNVALPGVPKANLHDLPEAAFERVVESLADSGVQVYCFGSTIMNWSKRVTDPFDVTLAEVRRAIPRMQRLQTRFVRIMSFKPGDDESSIPEEVIRRVREAVRMFRDAGLTPVHENCMNYGGMSARHALELLDRVPGLEWVFDTANPVFNADRSRPRPWPKQDPWEFWTQVKSRVAHIHVKDAIWDPARNDAQYTWPGEGSGRVREILADALAQGYRGALSIEPHMVVVFHDPSARSARAPDAVESPPQRSNYIEYGRRLMRLVEEVRPGTHRSGG